ncbi:cytosolic sulfotransferase 12-like [Senna tora]|uniref:Sulfotransferase n=1 Tax=Senna tora TaxID=362788 RepID=A0A834TT10_9FABA|nr:cytosolic sulfotransferase 12-like [Senna tora]
MAEANQHSNSSSEHLLPNMIEKEENISQECRDIISGLPREEGWFQNSLYQFQGFWHQAWLIQGALGFQKHFKACDDDILLVTTPKSGTTWLKAILYATLNRYPTFHLFPTITPISHNHPLLTTSPHLLLPFVEGMYQDNIFRDQIDGMASPRLLFTHMPYSSLPKSVKHSSCKIVFLCRNPKDNFVSLWHFANKIRPKTWGTLSLEEALDKFCRGVSPHGPFWNHVLEYWLESLKRPDKIKFLKYEDMKDQPATNLKILAHFIGHSFSQEEEVGGVIDDILSICCFENLSNLKVNKEGKLPFGMETSAFFRKGQVGDSVNYLSSEIIEKFDSITQEKLGPHGLKF